MRAFGQFTLLLALSLIGAAVLTYPAWLLVELISDQPVHRVMHRLAMLFALVGLIWMVRRQRLNNRDDAGYGMARRNFLGHVITAFVLGLMVLTPLVWMLLESGLRVPKGTGLTAGLIISAMLSGFVVALIEETFFRGVLQTAVQRESGVTAAIVLPSALYASLHFLGGRLRIPDDEVTWSVGFQVLAKLFEEYAHPLQLLDSWFALFAVGVLLAFARLRTGSIAACIGLHASWVATIAVTREVTRDNRAHSLDVLTGTYDGVIGWASLVWTSLLLIALLVVLRKRQSKVNQPPL